MSAEAMISPRAKREHHYWLGKTETEHANSLKVDIQRNSSSVLGVNDTVGAVALDDGNLAAGVSSGGILLKLPGRLGAAAVYGAACWVCRSPSGAAFACSISGTGEDIIRAGLAQTLCGRLCSEQSDTHNVLNELLQKFTTQYTCAEAGILLISIEKEDDNRDRARLWCAFTTPAMAIAYATSYEAKPKALILRQNSDAITGKHSICIKAISLA